MNYPVGTKFKASNSTGIVWEVISPTNAMVIEIGTQSGWCLGARMSYADFQPSLNDEKVWEIIIPKSLKFSTLYHKLISP